MNFNFARRDPGFSFLALDPKFFKAAFFLLAFCFFLFTACSVPELESPECSAARPTVKEFYSFHFGNDMKFNAENLQAREKFLSPEMSGLLKKFLTSADPFTLTDDLPRAFRVGTCRVTAADKTEFQVLLFWKDDARSLEREIRVEMVRKDDRWLINNIYNDFVNLQQTLNHK